MDDLEKLHQRILACRACESAGYIERAAPVVAGRAANRIMLLGQAPGITELEVRRPFAGRAGKELFRWMSSIDISENDFRRQVYMTAITKCYPGRSPGGAGDRRPSSQEIALCVPFLREQMAVIRPEALLLVGGLAIERYLPKRPLTEVIGRRFEVNSMAVVPLPHPSGASRWLNSTANRALLALALQHVRGEWDRWAGDRDERAAPAAIPS